MSTISGWVGSALTAADHSSTTFPVGDSLGRCPTRLNDERTAIIFGKASFGGSFAFGMGNISMGIVLPVCSCERYLAVERLDMPNRFFIMFTFCGGCQEIDLVLCDCEDSGGELESEQPRLEWKDELPSMTGAKRHA